MSLGEGQTFAGYTVVRRLGAGGMGEVYLAQHPRLPRRDALKVLTGGGSDTNYRERFLREADLASRLWHSHIVGVHDRGEYDGQLWISMDFVDGEDASSLIARKYPVGMPVDKATAIITAVASALDYAHKNGLLHRDVKPANILVTHEDDDGEQRILLTDFGIARTVDDNSGLTDTNTTVGTVDYAAPEQLMGETMDGRADQYSLAATAYHLLTGVPPFHDSNAAVVIGRHLNTQPPTLADTRPELAPLDGVLAAGLAKDPDHRFATCSEFARTLSARARERAGMSAPAAPTVIAPIKPPTRAVEETQAPAPLAPGWYPDPNGNGGTLYWDGRGWHTAPLPKARPTSVSVDEDSRAVGPRLWLALSAIAVAAAAIIVALVFAGSRNPDESESVATSTSSFMEPTLPPTRSRIPTTSIVPSTGTAPRTTGAPRPPSPAPSSVPFWNATVVGTCDEGTSCGVKQRVAPYVNAERLYPNDLRDGMTVQAVCYTIGDARTSSGHGTSSTWYRLMNGAYVNLVYTTLRMPIGMPAC
ncbi:MULTISPECIES: protein kinase domain-containing protein [Mycolicibacterium]|uniref:protein kinase domain-containing protein n=1 Tax=Mycolicibacterium TaxID=1866885 RepID=UPI001CA322F2|nr:MULTISPECIES: protein kinase [Mycolicibacterium]QZT65364.1 protein kinase [Mycolicibacterium austroafricanum]